MNRFFEIRLTVIAVILFQLVLVSSSLAQLQGRHTPMASIPGEGVNLYFWRYFPPGYDSTNTTKKYPLIVFLHGNGERYSTGEQAINLADVLVNGPPKEINAGNDMCFRVKGVEECFIVLSPQLGPSGDWGDHSADLLKYAVEHYNVDTNRLYVTGLSLGGIGSIDYVQNNSSWPYTTQLAAIGVAPGGEVNTGTTEKCLFATRDIPMWACHRLNDPTSRTRYTDFVTYVDAINTCSPAKAYLTTLPQIAAPNHDSWTFYYRTHHNHFLPNVYEWFLMNPKSSNDRSPFDAGAYAGDNQTVTGTTATLTAEGKDNDGGAAVSYNWVQYSGGTASITSPNSKTTGVTGLSPGVYKFKVTVTDDESTSQFDIVTITVSGNASPVAVANNGEDEVVTLPANSVNLTGSGTDSDGTIATKTWTQVNGPSTATITSPNSFNTSVTNLVQGTYLFRLTVVDNDGADHSDDVQVTVNPASGVKTWKSYDIVTQSSATQQGFATSDVGGVNATFEFYKSTDDGGVAKGTLFTTWNPGDHTNLNSRAEDYWANGTGSVYPYAGKSKVERGLEPGEGSAPTPLNVFDLQLHPPNENKLAVAAFIVPEAGNYTVSGLAVRRVSASGTTSSFKVFNQDQVLIQTLQATNNQDWVTSSTTHSLGALEPGDRIYFATDRDGDYAYDFTEVAFSISMTPITAAQSWHSYEITTQSNPSQQGVVLSELSTAASVEFYKSTDLNGVIKGTAFSTWNGITHGNVGAKVKDYWADASGAVYPYAGKSTIGRNSEAGEANTPTPFGVFDLQLHPPSDDKLTVAAFVIPVAGEYTVTNLAVRRVSASGATVAFKVFNNSRTQLISLQASNNQDWVTSTSTLSLGTMAVGDRIYFATGRDGTWDYDFTEVAWTVNLAGGSSMMMSSAVYDPGLETEDVAAKEETHHFSVLVYDQYGQYVKRFTHSATTSEISEMNLRPFVSQKGLYTFHMISENSDVKIKRIFFVE